MRISTNHLVLGLISALILGGAFAVSLALAGPARQAASTTTPGTGTATTQAAPTLKPTPVPPDLVRVWSSMCVEGVPYTLLSVPTGAKFALVVPEGQVAPPAVSSAAPSASSSGATTPGTTAPGTMTPQASIGSAVPATGATGALGQLPTQSSCSALGTMSGVQLVMCTGPQGHAFTLYVHNASGTQTFHGTLWDCAAGKAPAAPATTGSTSVPTTLPTMPPTGTLPPTIAPTNPPATPTP